MRCVDRKGNEIGENAAQGRVLKALYETAAGRILLGILVKPFVSKAGGFLLNQPVSVSYTHLDVYKRQLQSTVSGGYCSIFACLRYRNGFCLIQCHQLGCGNDFLRAMLPA